MHKMTTLPNGLRILTQENHGTESATVLVLVGAGSRYEERANNGVAHFLEHIFFKGGQKYTSSRAVSQAIDEVGGVFNAFTGKEYAGYYVKVDAHHLDRAYDVLSDMLLHPGFSQEDIERERQVIIQEYEMYQDTPIYQVGWDFERVIFGDQPLGWDQVGTKEFLLSVGKQEILDFREKLYTPENCVVVVAGAAEHEAVVASVQKFFPFPTQKKALEFLPCASGLAEGYIKIHDKQTNQGHLVLGVHGLTLGDERKYVQNVLTTLLGGSMSSRMFLRVREQRGLCYSIHTSADAFTDVGTFSTYAGVAPERIAEALSAICEEYRLVCAEPVGEDELRKTKECLKGRLTLAFEDSEEVAHTLGRQELLLNKIRTIEEMKRGIDAVTSEQVQELARELLAKKTQYLAVIGPFAGREEEFASLIKF